MGLRTLLIMVGGFLAVVCLAAAVALATLTAALARSSESVTESVESLRAAEELEIALLKHNSAMHRQDQPAVLATLRDVHDSLNRIESHITSPRERELANAVEGLTAAHIATIEQTPDPQSARFTESLNRVVSATETLAEFNVQESVAAGEYAQHLDRVANVTAIGVLVAVVLGLIAVVVIVRDVLYRRLLALRSALVGFRAGRTDTRAEVKGPRELQEIAADFNSMVQTLNRNREAQLEFVAGVAHDLRNPLGAMRLTASSLVRTPPEDPDKLHRSHERILHQVERLSRMVGDLLDTTRIHAGHLELRYEEYDLRRIAEYTAELYRPTSEIHELVLSLPKDPVPIRADSARIEQVLNNIVSNAIKYSPGGGTVRIEVAAKDGEACAAVTDEGVGISPEEQERIFEPFRRSKRTREELPGVGLGLSVARTLVEAHGGHIEVESVPGHGSTFRVWLPLAHPLEAGRAEAGAGDRLMH